MYICIYCRRVKGSTRMGSPSDFTPLFLLSIGDDVLEVGPAKCGGCCDVATAALAMA